MDETERLLGVLVERTSGIQATVGKIESNIGSLFEKANAQKSQLDKLQQAHDDRIKSGAECHQTVNVPAIPKLLLAIMSGSSGIVGGGIVLIIILVLKKWGIL